ncbi:MAG TPA: FAD-binding oxidoreductase, partial [Verrucomicrobiae bacterium]|nr:FAD-binding oxidoreductase [Verrucomicrobiae bacterium]
DSRMNAGIKILEHTPEDLTATIEAGITLVALQNELARHRQWLSVDPPHPKRLTIAELIDRNLSGPRRFGYGTVRDHLIGIKVALADGTIIHSGGKVVKNVAGYDLMKLFIGARGSLGTVLETTFKLRPLPEMERFVQTRCETLEQADKAIEMVMHSDLAPVVLDLVNAECGMRSAESGTMSSGIKVYSLVLGFAGTREEVEWQLERAKELGFDEPASLEYEEKFWNETTPTHRMSVLPSKIVEALRSLNSPFVARAGNGVIYHGGRVTQRKEELPLELMRRVKAAYDPKNLLPQMPL